jgi:hypothetical protein
VYPSGDDAILLWKARSETELYPFVIYADFESYLEERDGEETEGGTFVINEHKPSVSTEEKYQTPTVLYSGEDCMKHFFDSLLTEQRRISCILGLNYDMLPLTRAEDLEFNSSTHCKNCGPKYTPDNIKVHHHSDSTATLI